MLIRKIPPCMGQRKSPNTKAKKCYFFMLIRKIPPCMGQRRAFSGQKARLCARGHAPT